MNRIKLLSNNALKIIACISMVFDHLGYMLFPNAFWMRIVGRLAYPIFAFCLAEGCFYTRNRLKHLLVIAILGLAMQVVEYLFTNMTSFSIFIVFTFSIILIYIYDYIDSSIKNKNILASLLFILAFVGITFGLNVFIHYYDYFDDNYGFYGVMIPVLLYITKKYLNDKAICIFVQIAIIAILTAIRAYCFELPAILFAYATFPLLLMYNGKRGKWNMKYFFYIFYPAQFAVIYLIGLIIGI